MAESAVKPTPISVILLSYNTRELTLSSLDRLADIAYDKGWQIIVVDNASSDTTAEAIQRRFPRVELIQAAENRGYAAGNNLGIRRAEGNFLILLNSDVVVDAEAIEALVDYLRQTPDAGVVSPGLLAADGKPQAYAFGDEPHVWTLLKRNLSRLFGLQSSRDGSVSIPRDVDWVSGACMCVRREVVQAVGLIDERYFLYFEDVDWCRRMRKAGWRVVFYPQISVVHLGGASQPGSHAINIHYVRSLRMYYASHYSWPSRLLVTLLLKLQMLMHRRHHRE